MGYGISGLTLTFSTPLHIVVQAPNVASIRTAGDSAFFGIQPGHVAYLTVILPSVLQWHGASGPNALYAAAC